MASLWCVVVLAALASFAEAQPTKSKVSLKLESAMEQMKSECLEGTSESAIACLKYKVLTAIDELYKNDTVEVSEAVTVVRNTAPSEEARGMLDQLENYVQTHDVLVKLPGDSHLTFSPRNIHNGELNLSLKFDQDDSAEVSEARRKKLKKSKLKKILIPIAVFMLLKALTMIPLFIGILGIKAWNALQLSFGSFILSFALAIFQLCKKLAGDSAPPQPIVAHATGWDAQRSFDTGFDAQNMAYSAYAQGT